MTFRITYGIDPGLSGAIAALFDGVPFLVYDMPTMARKSGKQEVSCAGIAHAIWEVNNYPGSVGTSQHAVIELVGGNPIGGRKQGTTSMFNFGKSCGRIEGVIVGKGIPLVEVTPVVWKRHHGLVGADKDASRGVVMRRWPEAAKWVTRKKDDGRADAILIAAWHHDTEQHARAQRAQA
jgi:crossover junction endodeoxyribonuclease RuvC